MAVLTSLANNFHPQKSFLEKVDKNNWPGFNDSAECITHLGHLLVESYGGRAVEHHPNLGNQYPEHFQGEAGPENEKN